MIRNTDTRRKVFFLVEMMAGTPDNFTSLFFCIGMGVWATFFVHFWRRTAAKAALKWGTLGMSKQLEPTIIILCSCVYYVIIHYIILYVGLYCIVV